VPQLSERDRICQDVSFVLDALISLSASLAHPLESLSLIRLPPIHFPQYDHPGILSLRAHLSFFEIHSSSTASWSPIAPRWPRREPPKSSSETFYYSHTLPRRLLPPPSTATGLENLESLSLCFSDPIGVYSFTYTFSELHFPRLRALRLQHVQFSHESREAEYFVTRHADTLLELHLVHCEITESLDQVFLSDPGLAWGRNEPMFPSYTEYPVWMRPWSTFTLTLRIASGNSSIWRWLTFRCPAYR
jgi:hypothetical protein